MSKPHHKKRSYEEIENLRLEPQKRMCNKFDSASIAQYTVAKPGKMGFRVVDNCAEEHMM